MKRKAFVTAGAGSLVLATGLPISATAQTTDISPLRKGRRALVLSGGGSFGSYEAGVIQALVEQQGVSDGQPLDFDLICGTSIGGLGGYFVATAQYSQLRTLWRDVIATSHVADVKTPYNKINDDNAGVLNRLAAAIKLDVGFVHGLEGILDNAGFRRVLQEYVSPSQPVHIPMYFATTNLTRQAGRVFVRPATTPEGLPKQALNEKLLAGYSRAITPIRVADDSILHDVLYSTAAIPVAFDPGKIPNADGVGVDQYCDGGVTQNIPIGVARYCVEELHAVLVNPPPTSVPVTYDGLVDIALGVFGTMQRRILEYQVLLAYAESTTELPFTPTLIRPASQLAGSYVDFSTEQYLLDNYDRGYQDGRAGWQQFTPPPGMEPT